MKWISSSTTFKWHMGQVRSETGWGGLLNLPNSMVNWWFEIRNFVNVRLMAGF